MPEDDLTMNKWSEEDIKRLYVTPALEAKWDKMKISMETRPFTAGKINLQGNLVTREKGKKADYFLYTTENKPIAVVEAKVAGKSVGFGMQQAMEYARMQGLKFAYSTNGREFLEHDFLTGTERKFSMDAFPTEKELLARLKAAEVITDAELQIDSQPFYTGQNSYPPRYYQRDAVNAITEAVARGQKRVLITMATGTGKTYVAFQTIYRLLNAGVVKRVLYLADRNVLVDQSLDNDFRPLTKDCHKIKVSKDKKNKLTSYKISFALYQQLVGEKGEKHYEKLFKPDYFDLIIVDECHRGSAKEDSTWREILEYFEPAYQLGMTATPRETAYVSNIDYFGKPVYTYSLKQGIDDGFLAPFRVINVQMNIGEGWRPALGQLDANGKPIEDRNYTNSDFDYNLILEDRTREVAERITAFLKATDRKAKTIVFCPTEEAAERMRQALVNANSDMVKEDPDYVVRITGSDDYGKGKLKYFRSVTSQYPVIATTSKLLSTGVDVKMTKLIVIDQMINSMTEFKQIIGRGTRLQYENGKQYFTIMDMRNVFRLFADPEWDGDIVQDPNWPLKPGETGKPPQKVPEGKPYVTAEGCQVVTIQETISVYDSDGKLLKKENIIDYTKSNILGKYADLQSFIRSWSTEKKGEEISKLLAERGINLLKIKEKQNMLDVDDFDFLCHLAYDQKPLTRRERANNVKKRDFLNKYKGDARFVLEQLLEKYKNEGISVIEDASVLHMDPFRQFGSPGKIAKLFGGAKGYHEAIQELENEIYKMAV